jgi:hypothetical protein
MRCDYDYFCELQDAAHGLIKLVDIAPEEPGAIDFIDRVRGTRSDDVSGEEIVFCKGNQHGVTPVSRSG